MTSAEQEGRTRKLRTRTGVVASISGAKTVSVRVETLVKHERYGKYIRRWAKYAVHDPNSETAVGDTVEIASCRPISKRKSWRLVRVVRSATGAS